MTREDFEEAREDFWAEGAGRIAEIAGVATALVRNVGHHVLDLVDDATEDSRAVAREAEDLFESARDQLEDAREAVRAAPRLTRIVTEGLAILASHRMKCAVAVARAELTGQSLESRDALHRQTARRLRRLCEDQRGGILKLGQFVSTRRDLLPDAYGEELSKLQDRVPPVPTESLVTRLEQDLGENWGERFGSFEPTAIAAASLSQVHGATLTDGTPVAVKLLVPGIEDVVEADFSALRVLLPSIRELFDRVDLDTLVNELSVAVRRELDLEQEATAARELRAAFAEDPDVIVPKIHPDVSGPGVLVMERIEGERLLDFLDGCKERGESGERDRDRIFTILIRCFCEQILVHGLFQADPHPGNFLVVPGPDGPRLALLDFGCVERYDAGMRSRYAALAMAVLGRNEARVVELFQEIGFRSRDGSHEGLHAYAELFLAAFRDGVQMGEGLDHGAQIERILDLTASDPIAEIPGHFVLLGRVFASLGGLLTVHRPRIQLSALIGPSLAAALRTP